MPRRSLAFSLVDPHVHNPQREGVVTALSDMMSTAVCHLDADAGRLTYRGYDVVELATQGTFEETAWLLVRGELPDQAGLRSFRRAWHAAQRLTPLRRRVLRLAPGDADALTVLRAVIGALPFEEPAPDESLRLLACAPAVSAEWLRMAHGGAGRWGRDGVAHGFLRVATGREPAPALVRAFDGALTLRADNELNPGTFAARVAASTGSDLVSCVVAALGALAGPKHSGHTVAVARLLAAAGRDGVEAATMGSSRPAGFGHPVYRGEDPRTGVARALAQDAAQGSGQEALCNLALAVEEGVRAQTGLAPNVDFYLTVIFLVAGLPVTAFGAIFAMARMPGWIAHVMEQWQDPALIRPRAAWIGPAARPFHRSSPRARQARPAT